MAMFVLLRFEDDNQALTLIEDMQEYKDSAILTPTQENNVMATAVALFKAPTMFHEPFETHGGNSKTSQSFTKGQKWGWWVCTTCKKPSRLYWEQIVKECSFGRNIMSQFFTEENPG